MLLFDVNIYVHAHREDSPHHGIIRPFLEKALSEGTPAAHSLQVLAGFLRIVTHPGIFDPPTDPGTAFAFTASITEHPGTILLQPGKRHWIIFQTLCHRTRARGNLIPDAWYAALAMEHGCTWVSSDGDYTRFPGLTVYNPLVDT